MFCSNRLWFERWHGVACKRIKNLIHSKKNHSKKCYFIYFLNIFKIIIKTLHQYNKNRKKFAILIIIRKMHIIYNRSRSILINQVFYEIPVLFAPYQAKMQQFTQSFLKRVRSFFNKQREIFTITQNIAFPSKREKLFNINNKTHRSTIKIFLNFLLKLLKNSNYSKSLPHCVWKTLF